MKNLTELHLSKTVNTPPTRENLPIAPMQLKIFYYVQNMLSDISDFTNDTTGPQTSNLIELHLEDNKIDEIYYLHLQGLDSLEKLFLCRNNIRFIDNGAFYILEKLNYVYLDGNPLLQLEHMSLWSDSIQFMSLANTGLFLEPQYSSKNPLNFNNSISSLDLSGTNLNTHLLNGFAKYYQSLRSLNVSQNSLDTLASETFHKLLSLEELWLTNNSLTHISDSSLPPELWRQLKTLDLSGNPFRCDCSLFKFSQWIKTNNFSYSTKLLNNMQCVSYLNEKKQSFIVSKTENRLKMKCLVEENEWFLWALTATVSVISCLSTFASAVHRFRWNIRYWLFTHKVSLISTFA